MDLNERSEHKLSHSLKNVKDKRVKIIESKERKASNADLLPESKSEVPKHRHFISDNVLCDSQRSNFDLNSLKQEIRERHSSQHKRGLQIEEILFNSSDESEEEPPPRAMVTETQPDSVEENEVKKAGLLASVFCCCGKLCKIFKV